VIGEGEEVVEESADEGEEVRESEESEEEEEILLVSNILSCQCTSNSPHRSLGVKNCGEGLGDNGVVQSGSC
jgi:hypothetical protein